MASPRRTSSSQYQQCRFRYLGAIEFHDVGVRCAPRMWGLPRSSSGGLLMAHTKLELQAH